MITEFDEINQIENIEKQNKGSIESYEKYFGEMELEDSEKEERVSLAKKFEMLFLFYFLMLKLGSNSDLKSIMEESYISIAKSFTNESAPSAYVSDRAKEVSEFVEEITRKHIDEEYYTSIERGMLLSANESNLIGNYREFAKAVKEGKTKKIWRTFGDERVRKTHRAVNGKEVGIFELFKVGDSEMRFPHDAMGSVKETANCRCHVEYI